MKIQKYYSKRIPRLITVFLLLITVFAFPFLFLDRMAEGKRYEELLLKAEEYSEKGIYVEARDVLLQALETEGDKYRVYTLLAQCATELDDKKSFLSYCEKAVETEPEREEAYVLLSDYYAARGEYAEVYSLYGSAVANGCESQILEKQISELSGIFVKKRLAADTVGDWNTYGGTAYALFSRNGLYGILRSDGYVSLAAEYEKLGVYSGESGTYPAYSSSVPGWFDASGYRRLSAPEGSTYIGSFSSSFAPVCLGELWSYIDTDGNVMTGTYTCAGCFSSGYAAVEKDGKWAFVNSRLCTTSAFEFDEIVSDSNGCSCLYGLAVIKKDGLMYLCTPQGTVVSGGYEDMALPAGENGYIACKAEGLWGFIDCEGNTVIEPEFENAKSFSQGLAPVCVGEKWYYIDMNGEKVNSETFDEAGNFSCEGRAAVKTEGKMYIITLAKYS